MAKTTKKTAKKKAVKRAVKIAVKSKAKAAKGRAVSKKKVAARKPAKAKVAKKAVKRKAPVKSKAERAHDELVANAFRALELKKAAPKPFRPENRTSDKGMPSLPNETIAPAGAIEAEEAYSAKGRAHGAR